MPAELGRAPIPCNLCGADDTELLIETVPIGEGGEGKVFASTCDVLGEEKLVRCRKCGLMYLNPRPETGLILDGYTQVVDDTYTSQEEGRLATFAAVWEDMRPRLGVPKGRLLDVGAAAGYMLKAPKDAGWDVEGVEPSLVLRDYARKRFGIDMKSATVEEAEFPAGSFDAVTLMDVLEHVTDPAGTLGEVCRVLKPGGLVVVNYPDISDFFARLAGRRWWFLLSAHLYYFTPETLAKLLEKTGFEPLEVKAHFQKLQLGYLLERLKPYSGLVSGLGSAVARGLGLSKLLIPYYASQRRYYARKRA